MPVYTFDLVKTFVAVRQVEVYADDEDAAEAVALRELETGAFGVDDLLLVLPDRGWRATEDTSLEDHVGLEDVVVNGGCDGN